MSAPLTAELLSEPDRVLASVPAVKEKTGQYYATGNGHVGKSRRQAANQGARLWDSGANGGRCRIGRDDGDELPCHRRNGSGGRRVNMARGRGFFHLNCRHFYFGSFLCFFLLIGLLLSMNWIATSYRFHWFGYSWAGWLGLTGALGLSEIIKDDDNLFSEDVTNKSLLKLK